MAESVLVTGATGFLGSWLSRALIKMDLDVHVLQRTTSDLSGFQDLKVSRHWGDVTDLESMVKATKNIHTVFHLAGLIAYTKKQRIDMERINVGGTENVITACSTNEVSRLVHVSSVAAIGASFDGAQPLTEQSPYNLENLNLGYFETKRQAEQRVLQECTRGKLDAVVVNPSTIYGAGDALKGSRKTQIKVAKGQFPFYTKGGVNVVGVEDVVAGMIKAWQNGKSGQRYILSGENLTIEELFAMIARAAKVLPPRFLLPNWAVHGLGQWGDFLSHFNIKGPLNSENAWTAVLFHWFDSSKAQRELGFKSSPAEQAIGHSVEWMSEHDII